MLSKYNYDRLAESEEIAEPKQGASKVDLCEVNDCQSVLFANFEFRSSPTPRILGKGRAEIRKWANQSYC